nr:hypothetical protein [Tanacetum cinerariifolium]
MYPEYIPLEDEHVLPAEEQPLPHVDSPTSESPGYVAESDPEEDPEEDDADDEDEDDEDEEEEEEHLASADATVVVPTVDPISPPEGIEPVIPPPSDSDTSHMRFFSDVIEKKSKNKVRRKYIKVPIYRKMI